jgi:hypothetical protein
LIISFLTSPTLIAFFSPGCSEAVHLATGKSLLLECHPLDDQIVRALLLPTFVFAQWWLFEAATVRVGKRCKINVLNTLASRHHCANILLPDVGSFSALNS